jgi:maleylacetoacetate isomerase
MTTPLRLYTYWRSSAAWRVRIALALKGIPYEVMPVSLIADGGQQHSEAYAAINPQQLVPTLVLPDGTRLSQSLAIIDWLEAMHPAPALCPADPLARAKVLAVAHVVAMDIHPINNLRVTRALADQLGADAPARTRWMHHWMRLGFNALDGMIEPGPFACGEQPTLADLCLVPQFYNARRWGMDLAEWPRLATVETACLALPAFSSTAPEAQPDAL